MSDVQTFIAVEQLDEHGHPTQLFLSRAGDWATIATAATFDTEGIAADAPLPPGTYGRPVQISGHSSTT